MKHSIFWERNWNEKQIAAGRPYAVLPIRPLHQRVRIVVRWYWLDFRGWLALKIAPWLEER